MSEKGPTQGTMDVGAFWKQWQDVTAQMWSGVLEQRKSATTDPFGLYTLWLKNVGEAQSQAWSLAGLLDPREAWKQWFEATSGAWKRVAEMGADPLGLTTAWLDGLEQARARMSAGDASPAAAFDLYKQWYDATSETWARSVGDLFASEQFMEAVKQFLESYAGFAKTIRKANEDYFHGLQLPTRSDIARLGELIVALEEKVDRLDDAFADYKEEAAHQQEATGDSSKAISTLQKHISQLEASMKPLPQALESIQGINTLTKRSEHVERRLEAVDGLAKRLEQLEHRLEALDTLGKRLDQMQRRLETLDTLGKRMEQFERKLDAALAALEKNASKPAPASRKAANTSESDEPAQ
jgi:polyhydroxyalkanoic acid synthase PhaR subunit